MPQCGAITKSGKRCKNSVPVAGGRCHLHRAESARATPQTPRPSSKALSATVPECLRRLQDPKAKLTANEHRACLQLLDQQCVTASVRTADKKCAERRAGSVAYAFHDGKFCCCDASGESVLQYTTRTLSLTMAYLEYSVGGVKKVRALFAKLKPSASLSGVRALLSRLKEVIGTHAPGLLRPTTLGMLALAGLMLSMGWTASAFGDWASTTHGTLSVQRGAGHMTGEWSANAAAAASRAMENVAAENKLEMANQMVVSTDRLIQNTAESVIKNRQDAMLMSSLQAAAHALLPPGAAHLTTVAVLLSAKLTDDPETASTLASIASSAASSLGGGALATARALGWVYWNTFGTSAFV